MKSHTIRNKGFQYSIRTAELVRYLQEQKKGFPLSEKLLSCGLEAGMHCRQGDGEKDLQELAAENIKEADFIIEMAVYAGYLTEKQSLPIREEGSALLELLQQTGKSPG